MADWGLCATVKAPAEQVLAFVAHHLRLGAARLWLFFDDPTDPAFDAVAGIPGVTATRCNAAHWQAVARRRPDKHQNRQSRNMQWIYAQAELPWVGHIDVDEFLRPAHPIAAVLDSQPDDRIMVRMAPWEALHDPALADDIFTARRFRGPMNGAQNAAHRARAFGGYADLLPSGSLSHAAGKCFFRSGKRGLEPRIHGAFRFGERLPGGAFIPEIALLHFHAEDPDRWKHRLHFRLTRGAYLHNPPLQAHLLAASAAGVDAFYAAVQNPDAQVLAYLAGEGLMLEADLALRASVADLTDRKMT